VWMRKCVLEVITVPVVICEKGGAVVVVGEGEGVLVVSVIVFVTS
jgi:hypothetical protein